MTFLNLALLAGVAALAVPLAIHLLSRRSYQLVPWGAMFLIDQVVRRHRRRVKIEQWILLGIRCCIPVLLALAMARPVLTGWRALAGDEPVSAVIILDASYSMSAPTPAGSTAAQASHQALATVLSQLPQGSEARLLIAGAGTRLLDEGAGRLPDPAALALPPAALGPADLPAAISSAGALLERSRLRRRQVVLISDFQAQNWTAAAAPQLPQDTELAFVHIPTAAVANAAVEDVTLSPQLPAPDRPVRVRAKVTNTGAADLDSLAVQLFINGQLQEETRLSLPAGAAGEVVFITRFEDAGQNIVEVVLSGDEFAADNRFSIALNIPEALGVLLVGRRPGMPFPQSPTDFLQIAVEPGAGRAGESLSPLRPNAITADELGARTLADNRVVILAGIERLSDPQMQLLADFVRTGGGLILIPGERTDPAFIERNALFPARLQSLRQAAAGASPAARLAGPPYAHHALLPWNDTGSGRLREASIRRWYELALLPGAATLLALESGEPFLVEQRLGQGVVMMAASAMDGEWSDLPLRAAFLPLMQQLVSHAATAGLPPHTLRTGEPITFPLDAADDADQLAIITPAGRRHAVTTTIDRGRTLARFSDTAKPGLYHLVRPSPAGAPADPEAAPQGHNGALLATFAINAPRIESDLATMSDREVRQLATALGGSAVSGGEAYAAMERNRRFGREAWRWVWIALLALLFGELFLQGWFNRPESAGGGR